MARQLRFRHRIGALVVLAAVALISVTAVTLVLGSRSKRELAGIETRYLPLIELDRDLEATLKEIVHALEDAAAAADEGRLADADRLDRAFLARLAEGRETLRDNGSVPGALQADYGAYYARAREVAAAIVGGTPAGELGDKVEDMRKLQQTLVAHLEVATLPDRRRLTAAFETARESQENALRIEVGVAAVTILLMSLISLWITRRTVRSLHDVSIGVERIARGEFGQEIAVTSGDEFGDLAREANRTAARLREYRHRSETLLAETQRQAQELARAKQAEQERREIAENATRELEAFSYSVAHDLRAPLRGINGFSTALLEDLGERLDPQSRDHLMRIRIGSIRMGELIDALLGLSRVSRAEMARLSVNLSKNVNDVLTTLHTGEPERHVRCIVQDGIVAQGDPQLLRALLENLLGNAWKFVAKRDDALIEFGQGNDRAYFVRDNGAGFDMAYASKLFVPFQRLHAASDYPGTGIGLATVQRIVRRHGGTIWAEGEVGKGATFYFTLPAAES